MTKNGWLLFMIMALAVSAAGQNISKAIAEAGTSEDFPEASHLVVFDSIHNDVQESGLSYVNTHRLYKVLDKEGAKKLRVIKYDYDPLSAYVEIHEVKIHRKDGRVETLDTAKVQDFVSPARMIYWGASEKMIEVGRLEPGDAVEVKLFKKGFTYALLRQDDEKYVPPMRGHFYDIVRFYGNKPILKMVYVTDVPKDKPLQYQFYNGEVQVSSRFIDDKIRYKFSKEDMMPLKREPGMVAMDNVAPKLLMSTSPDWEAKSRWFYGVNEDYGSFETTPEIDEKVEEILQGAKTEMDSISLLTHWVADNIRYSGLSMGEGEGYTLHTGEMTFEDRCGVCKDKASMLITMLRAAGFESYAAMTMAGSRIDDLPADQFNHSVTVVKLADGTWELLDPTWVPFVRELWSSAEQQQNYLLGLPKGADLMKTPVSEPSKHYFEMEIEGALDEEGTLEASLYVTAEGQSDAAIRRAYTRGYRTEWERQLTRELMKIHPDIVIHNMNFGSPYDYQEGPIRIMVQFIIPKYAFQTSEKLIYHPVSGKGAFNQAMAHLSQNITLEERKYPFRDRCSREVTLSEHIMLPAYKSINKIDDKVASDADNISYNGVVEADNGELNISQKAIYPKRVYEAAEWPAYRDAVAGQKKVSQTPVIINF
jgi:transglutaminase-like putative cysteine protease